MTRTEIINNFLTEFKNADTETIFINSNYSQIFRYWLRNYGKNEITSQLIREIDFAQKIVGFIINCRDVAIPPFTKVGYLSSSVLIDEEGGHIDIIKGKVIIKRHEIIIAAFPLEAIAEINENNLTLEVKIVG